MTSTTPLYVLLFAGLGVAFLGLTLSVEGQRSRTDTGTPTSFDDIVFAISFSPDGRTLAIARGASEPAQRFGRIELWDTETLQLRFIIKGFDGPVRSISFSPDGHTLISGSTEFRSSKLQQQARSRAGSIFSELKWWDTRTGELKQKLTMPGDNSYSIRAIQSPDGKQLALTESFRQSTRLFSTPIIGAIAIDRPRTSYWLGSFFKVEMKLVNAETGELKHKLDMDQAGAASFSPDGNLLAVANGNQVKLCNSQTGREVRKLKDLRGTVNAVAFAPNGRSLAVASIKHEREYAKDVIKIIGISEVKIFDVDTGKVTNTLKDVGAVNTLAFSPNGRVLLVGGVLPGNKREVAGIMIFDFQTGKVNTLSSGGDYTEAVDSLVFSRNSSLLAFRSGPATVKLLDTQSARVKQTWDADSVGDAVERPASRYLLSVSRVLAVAFSADGTTVAGETDRGEIKLWDHRTGEVKQQLRIEQDDPSLVAVSMDGKSFAEISQGTLLFWNANSDKKTIVPLPGPHTVAALALSADGRMFALGSGTEVVLLSPTGEVAKKLSGPEGLVNRLTFSQDGSMLAGAEEDGTINIWKLQTGSIEKTFRSHTEITALVFAPHQQTLATAATDNTISLWNLQTGLPEGKFQKHDGTINALAFSPNGQLLASGGDDRTIVLWEIAGGKSKRTFKGHDQTVSSLAFSPDGQLLASGSGNASVVLWEVGTGKLNRVLKY
ncbi:MAG: WD40 repeat domain-containing protein [Pyrinomonadaceae bacterium]|nr:WD40 repeat domain-containing protein [Pyrinomonadaceae bacterium]